MSRGVFASSRGLRLAASLTVLGLSTLAPDAASGQEPTDPGGALTYVFVIDGLDGDRVDAGRAPKLSALLAGSGARATYFKESRSVMVAETNPNHIAMATGAYTDTTGIPGNSFAVYGATADAESCPTGAADETRTPTQTSGLNPACLRVPTMFESAERSADRNRIVTAGIFGKPKLARIFSGRKANANRYDADYLWTPCGDGSSADYCKSDVPSRPGDAYATSDADVMNEVMRTARVGVAGDGRTFTGGGKRPNLTFVNLPLVDATGHINGAGTEYDVAIGRADDQIARFVAQQKKLGLWKRTVMVILSDHSMDSTPEQTSLAERFTRAGISSSSYRIVRNGSAALIYLSDRTDPGRFELLRRMRAAARDGGTVLSEATGRAAVEALYREPNPADGGQAETIATRHPDWNLGGERVGDLVVTSRIGWSFDNPASALMGNHGGPQTRDNFFAVVGGAPIVRQGVVGGVQDISFDDTARNPQSAENVDVAPTVLSLLGQPAPRGSEGRVLTEALSCGAGAALAPASVKPSGSGLRFSLPSAIGGPVTADVFSVSSGSRVLRASQRVTRFSGRSSSFTWRTRGLKDGIYFARLRVDGNSGVADTRSFALEYRSGRFRARSAFEATAGCGMLASFALDRPVFGGASDLALTASYTLAVSARVEAQLLRGSRVVKRLGAAANRSAGRTYRLRIAADDLPSGEYRMRLRVTQGGTTTSTLLGARKL